MKKLIYCLLLILFISFPSIARAKYQGIASKGGKVVKTSISTSYKLQENYPACTVTVYFAGTTNLAPIYTNNSGTVKANPFASDSTNASYFFYADDGRYDIKFSGTGISTPFTMGDILLFDSSLLSSSIYPVNPYQFGAFGTGVSHQITNNDITAHPEWLGTYTVGTEWDTVAVQEGFYAAFGTGTPTRYPLTVYLNKEFNFRNGKYLINRTLHINAVVGMYLHGIRKATQLLWTGSDPNVNMWEINGLAYGEIGDFSLVNQNGDNNKALLDVDYTGPYVTLKTQQLTFKNIDFTGTYSSTYAGDGFRINFVGGASAQGDTIILSNINAGGFTLGAGIHMKGFNVLQVTVQNGDSLFNKYGLWLEGAEVHTYDFHCEMDGKAQIARKGYCIFQSPPPSNGKSIVEGTRSESPQFAYGVGVINNATVGYPSQGFSGFWQALANYSQSSIVLSSSNNEQKAFMAVQTGPTVGNWFTLNQNQNQVDLTKIKVSETLVPNDPALVGNRLDLKFVSNGFTARTDVIDSNTTSEITLHTAFPYGPMSFNSQYRIVTGPDSVTDATPPNWTNVDTRYFSGIDPADAGAGTTSGSPIIHTPFGSDPANIGLTVIVAGAGENGDYLIGEVISTGPGNTFTIDKNASVSIPYYGQGGDYTVFGTPMWIGTPIVDDTVKWLPFDYYSVVLIGANKIIQNSDIQYGRIWGYTNNLTLINNEFTRNDWLKSVNFTGRITSLSNTPNNGIDSSIGAVFLRQNLITTSLRQTVTASLATTTPIDIGTILTTGNIIPYTPTQDSTINIAIVPTQEFTLTVTTSGATSYTITFGTNFKTTGTLATGVSSGKVFTLKFSCNGTICAETSRTIAM